MGGIAMKIILTNDKKRKEFLDEYWDEEKGWYVLKYDSDFQITYYRADLEDGSHITVMEGRGFGRPVKTLTKKGKMYFPVPTTQGDLIEHLKQVANK